MCSCSEDLVRTASMGRYDMKTSPGADRIAEQLPNKTRETVVPSYDEKEHEATTKTEIQMLRKVFQKRENVVRSKLSARTLKLEMMIPWIVLPIHLVMRLAAPWVRSIWRRSII